MSDGGARRTHATGVVRAVTKKVESLTKRKPQVPARLEDIQRFILVGREALKAHMAKIRALDKIGEAYAAKEAALTDAQSLSEALIEAEARLGEILAKIEKKGNELASTGGRKATLPEGINWKQSHQAQTIASHQDVAEQVMVQAREEKRIATPEEVYREIKREEAAARVESLAGTRTKAIPEGTNEINYCDPPWKYDFEKADSRKIENQYPTMEVEEICTMKLPNIADNALLLMWATAPKLTEALSVITAWGFAYRTHCVWNKKKIGMGYWFRGQHELLLVATKGDFSPPDVRHRKPSVYEEERGKHSVKPLYFYKWIEGAFEGKKKIELFARGNTRTGWEVWGTLEHERGHGNE